jgi:hypothetical protein
VPLCRGEPEGCGESRAVEIRRAERRYLARLCLSAPTQALPTHLNAALGLASDDPATSAREAIVPIVNGQTGVNNPPRQGLDSALAGEGAPPNIIQEEPALPSDSSSQFYSPIWDITPGVWTDTAISTGLRVRLTSIEPTTTSSVPSVEQQAQFGNLVSASFANGPDNPTIGLQAANFVSLCPVMAVLPIGG